MKKQVRALALKILFRCVNQEKLLSTLLKINYSAGADIKSGGEAEAMRYLHQKIQKKYPNCQYEFFDVGANIGNYSIELNKEFGESAQIHAFEPLCSTYKMLIDHLGAYSDIICHNLGFSDQTATMSLYTDHAGSGLTSVYHRRLDHFNIDMNIKEECEFTTVDKFCQDNHIERIHFLKIDVEGHELAVLGGGKKND